MANGVWSIVIQGTGPYQNTDINAIQYDADKLLPHLVEVLSNAGHVIKTAGFYNSQPGSLTPPTAIAGRKR